MAIYKCGQGFELATTENKSNKSPEEDQNPGPLDCESDALTSQPHYHSITFAYILWKVFCSIRLYGKIMIIPEYNQV